jgi:hypothetical protein
MLSRRRIVVILPRRFMVIILSRSYVVIIISGMGGREQVSRIRVCVDMDMCRGKDVRIHRGRAGGKGNRGGVGEEGADAMHACMRACHACMCVCVCVYCACRACTCVLRMASMYECIACNLPGSQYASAWFVERDKSSRHAHMPAHVHAVQMCMRACKYV